MSKGLEALRDINYICDRIDFHRKHFLGNVDEDWIEKRIKQKSFIIEEELKEGQKAKKALEIIKKYGHFDNDTSDLIVHIPDGKNEDEEYDLLKEVLL